MGIVGNLVSGNTPTGKHEVEAGEKASRFVNRQTGAHITNIFLIYSPLHYLVAENIAANFEQTASNALFYLKEEFRNLVDTSKWDCVEFLPWPRFYPEKGVFGKIRRTRKNLEIVKNVCPGSSEIRLHTPVIDTEAVNYFINYLRKSIPAARFSVRLLPDGLLNVQRHPLGCIKELLQYGKKLRRLISPALDYYLFKGDRTGSDAAITDRIYVLKDFPHEYDPGKVVELSLQQGDSDGGSDLSRSRRALVLGQPLVAYDRFSVDGMRAVGLGIRAFIAACGINDVMYKSHPRDPDRDFSHPDYHELIISAPLETHLTAEQYDLVIGVCSTGLLTARMILPASCRVVAYGMDIMMYRGDSDKKNIEAPFVRLGVEMVPHSAPYMVTSPD